MFGPLPRLLARLGVALGACATYYYAASGLTLSHYDAKAHLVVSRRILDSITPGWEQIGAVWLPLPHLLNMVPVQIDHFYRTGAFAIGLSVLFNGLATASIAGTVLALTASRAGAVLAAALYATNPNVLYLQSTPMTEPMLFGLTACQVFIFTRWVLEPAPHGGAARRRLTMPAGAGWVTVAACLTRYEAWPITAACFGAAAYAQWRRGNRVVDVVRVHARLAIYPLVTALGFMVFSRITVGAWFVSGGFFVPDPTLLGQPWAVGAKIVEGVELVSGVWLLRCAVVSIIVVGLLGVVTAGRAAMLVPLALLASVALPLSAYLSGHPFRMRYEIPLVLASAVAVGLGVGLLKRVAPVAAILVLAVVLNETRPFDRNAAMIREAQLDQNVSARGQVTACLKQRYQGGKIMASMGSLGHYMHEMSAAGFEISDFLHEGNGPIWDSAFTRGPAALVEWVLVEEQAEGGDAVIQRHRQLPRLLQDYDQVCAGGNVTLYRRRAR
ncbi:MAG TPA: hypothetical protein VNJ02_11750 [Vicinamibacterales bacterium]|nr:hypothetical protein [Vicinamibacterales bacterium]